MVGFFFDYIVSIVRVVVIVVFGYYCCLLVDYSVLYLFCFVNEYIVIKINFINWFIFYNIE